MNDRTECNGPNCDKNTTAPLKDRWLRLEYVGHDQSSPTAHPTDARFCSPGCLAAFAQRLVEAKR